MRETASRIWFVARTDIVQQFRRGSTLVWVFLMPPIFFYFIGTVVSGFAGVASDDRPADPIAIEAAGNKGFLVDELQLYLEANGFAVVDDGVDPPPTRILMVPEGFTDAVVAGETALLRFETNADEPLRDYEKLRVDRAVTTLLADLTVAEATGDGEPLAEGQLASVRSMPRALTLDVQSAGKRARVPSGMEQTIPGMMVMFTLIVLLTSSATFHVIERNRGLLRRLASTPLSVGEVVAGKWASRMVVAVVQVAVGMATGTLLFGMDWGPDIAAVGVVLLAWAAFCASFGLVLGAISRTEMQAAGIGLLAANVLAALGGAWWPIEITPDWMQTLQKYLPTGWTMDAMHRLVSFQMGPLSVLPHFLVLVLAALAVGWVARNRFTYE